MKPLLRKLTNILLLSVAFTLLLSVALTMEVRATNDAPGTGETAPASLQLPRAVCDVSGQGTLARGETVSLTSLDGAVPLLDTPASAIERQSVRAGTTARIIDGTLAAGACWYLVELPTAAGTGWVPDALVHAGS